MTTTHEELTGTFVGEKFRRADWIIDLGPEGGKRGGKILFEGTPEEIMKCERSWTGRYLKGMI